MKVVDANVLLYAVNEDAAQHAVARECVDGAVAGDEVLAFPWLVVLAFLRISTHPAIFGRPLSPDQAFDIVESWLAQPAAVVVEPTARHLSLLRGLLQPVGTAGNLTNDAHLAAVAVEYGAEIVSFDTDFERFPGVRVRVPGRTS